MTDDVPFRPGSRMVARLIGEAQLATGVDVLFALQQHLGRHVPFERAILLLVVLRSSSRFRMTSTGVALSPTPTKEGISINAMASSLDRSFETVRRHVNNLINDEICERSPDGVIVSNTLWQFPIFIELINVMHDRMVGVIADLKRFGIPLPNDRADHVYDPDATIAAIVDLTLATFEYFGANHRNWLELLVLNTVALAGARSISFDPKLGRQYGDSHAALPEDMREPISIAGIARTLRMTEPTVRREVKASIAAGNLTQVGRHGLRATTSYLEGISISQGSQLVAARAALILQRLGPGGFCFSEPERCFLKGRPAPLSFV